MVSADLPGRLGSTMPTAAGRLQSSVDPFLMNPIVRSIMRDFSVDQSSHASTNHITHLVPLHYMSLMKPGINASYTS